MNAAIVLSVGGFALILATLVLLRAKSSRFEVKPADIVVAVVPVLVFLLVTGKLQKFEIGEGGVKIETAFVKASASTIDPQVTPLAGIAAESRFALIRKGESTKSPACSKAKPKA